MNDHRFDGRVAVVTGAGPHAGDTESPRNGLDPETVSQVHATSVYVLVALTVALLVVALRGGHRWLARVTGLVLAIELLQGVLGWVQYELDLPVLLMRGAESGLLTAATAARMAEKPGVTLAAIPGCGHAPALMDPEQTGMIRGFLRS